LFWFSDCYGLFFYLGLICFVSGLIILFDWVDLGLICLVCFFLFIFFVWLVFLFGVGLVGLVLFGFDLFGFDLVFWFGGFDLFFWLMMLDWVI